MLKYVLILLILFVSCEKKENTVRDIISSASYGTAENRIHFKEKGANYVKVAHNASSFDDVSGPTYSLKLIETNENDNSISFHYTSSKTNTKVIVSEITTNSVKATIINADNTETVTVFEPRGSYIGVRPDFEYIQDSTIK